MSALGGAGGALGSMLGHAVGRGGLILGAVVGGVVFVVGGGFLCQRLGWIRRSQRFWTIAGGLFGFALACLVALSTLSSPVGPVLSSLLVGAGALLGALLGQSAHTES